MKKICFVVLPAHDLFQKEGDQTSGGAELQTYYFAKELARTDQYEVHCMINGKKKETYHFEGMIVHSLGVRNKAFLFLRLLISILKISPSYIYKRGIGMTLLPLIVAKYIGRNNTKLLYHIANQKDVNGDRFKGVSGKILQSALHCVDTMLLQTAEQYTLLSPTFQKKVTYNHPIRNIYYLKSEGGKIKNSILWVARCVPFKQPEVFVSLAKQFSEEQFVMICPPVDLAYWQSIKKIASSVSNLTFIKSVQFKEIQSYFDAAKVFINTSTHEGYPNTFLQAIDAKTPIVSLQINPDELLTEYNIGVDCKGSVTTLKKELTSLLTNETYYQTFDTKRVTYLQTEHNAQKNINKFMLAIESIPV